MPPGAANGTHSTTGIAGERVAVTGGVHVHTHYGSPAPCSPQPARSNIPALYKRDFAGRRTELARLDTLLADSGRTAVVVLHGPPGAGKTELAYEYARRHAGRYPGGCFMVDAGGGTPVGLAEIGQRVFGLSFASGLTIPGQCEHTLAHVSGLYTLLIYDNARGPDLVSAWLPAAGAACHVVITSLGDEWDGFCHEVPVAPLPDTDCLDLIAGLTDRATSTRHGAALIAASGGFPVQLVPATTALSKALRRGRDGAAALALKPEAESSFRAAYDTLAPPAQLLLHAAAVCSGQRLDQTGLETDLAAVTGWDHETFLDHRDACLDRHLLDGGVSLRMHHLIATFVLGQPAPAGMQETLQRVRHGQWDRLLTVANALGNAPARTDLAGELARFSVDPLVWERAGVTASGEDHHCIGYALTEIGQFRTALPWFQRAVEVKEKGGIHGNVDHQSLGANLHLLGLCLYQQGQYPQASAWFERAVEATEKGDIRGRVDHESLGKSLHLLGLCLYQQGQYPQASAWFQRAVEVAEKGDIHGRVNHQSRGGSLHQVGACLSQQGKYPQANAWFQRAVKAQEKGDIHGNVHHQSLGISQHCVGVCLSRQGQYPQASAWFQRAVEAAEKGDIHGRVDHESLGASLHEAGLCLYLQGQYPQASAWFQRAVEAAEKGDIHGRVDHESLGKSLQEVGVCLSRQGLYPQASAWFQRAVKAAGKGDIHGRVDHQSRGASLHQVGVCLSRQGQYPQASTWFQQAVETAEKGDIHGRVNHESLGISLHEAGVCLSLQGQYPQASAWFQRAVEAKERGDIHGRVDHASLAISLDAVGFCLSQQGHPDQAAAWFERAEDERVQAAKPDEGGA